CDGLALGALVAVLLRDRGRVERHAWAYSIVALAVIAAMAAYPVWGRLTIAALGALLPGVPDKILVGSLNILVFDVAAAGLIALLVVQSGHLLLAPLRLRPLTYLGTISYGIYMYHNLVRYLYMGPDRREWTLAWTLAYFAITLAVAAASWRFLEEPILGLKDRFDYGPRTSPARAGLAAPAPASVHDLNVHEPAGAAGDRSH